MTRAGTRHQRGGGLSASAEGAGPAAAGVATAGFARTFVLTSYGLVGVAFATVASSGEVGVVAPALFLAAMVASAVWPGAATRGPAVSRAWTIALALGLVVLVGWSLQDDNWLLHALEFALLVTASRLFLRRYAKDWMQLYALSFLLMLVAAVIYPTMTFALAFLIYAVLAIWALTMLHLVRRIEVATQTTVEDLEPELAQIAALPLYRRVLPWRRRYLRPLVRPFDDVPAGPVGADVLAWQSRQLVRGRFLLGTSALALATLAGSMLFFFLFPRVGLGFFFAHTRGTQSVTGFAEQVQLGGFGRIKTDAAVVMRISFPDEPARLHQPLRLRGLAFDVFDGQAWSRSAPDGAVLPSYGAGARIPGPELDAAAATRWAARVYLEPLELGRAVAFHPPGTRQISFVDSQFDGLRGRRKRIARNRAGDLHFVAPKGAAVTYQVDVMEPRGETARRRLLAASTGDVPPHIQERYTALPPGVDPRIAALSQQLAGAGTPADKALALEAALRRDWTYSLAGDQDPRAPLLDFLFGKRSGHCEYFATAMALLARTQGIPARVVNGFAGGEANEVGGYRMIRQGDAHSWVEIYLPPWGWMTFDPTPAAGQVGADSDGVLDAARRLADSAKMLWLSWVVEYDLERQMDVLRRVGRSLRALRQGLPLPSLQRGRSGLADRSEGAAERRDAPADIAAAPWLAAALLVVVVVLLLASWRWWRQRPAVFDRRLARALGRLQRLLAAAGHVRATHQTWHDVADVASLRGDPELASALRLLAQAWDVARWRDPTDRAARSLVLTRAAAATSLARARRRTAQRALAAQEAPARPLPGAAATRDRADASS